MSFMRRDDRQVMLSFKDFNLERTNFSLEYATVEPNRWDNYLWWSNTDLPMIKRTSKGKIQPKIDTSHVPMKTNKNNKYG